MAKKKVETKRCNCCGEDKELKEFWASQSLVNEADKKLPLCRKCIEHLYWCDFQYYANEQKALYHTLMTLDIYFDEDLFNSIKSDGYDRAEDLILKYIPKINNVKYRGKTSRDSKFVDIFDEENTVYKVEKNNKGKNVFLVTKEVVDRWGEGREISDYEFLENRYDIMFNTYDNTNPMSIWTYMQIAKNYLSIKKEEEKSNPDYKKINALNEAISKQAGDCKMKQVQASKDKEEMYFSQFIKEIEEYEPIVSTEREFKDVDSIKKYFTRWFIKPFARARKIDKGEDYEDD